ncbi:MAG: histidine phosphatase family protein, partial [Nitratireductor sp.]
STATRAQDTCAPMMKELGDDVPVIYREELYHAMPDQMLAEIHHAPDSADTLLVIGHNPGLVLLAMALAVDPDDEVSLRISRGVPTGGFIVFDFDIDHWADLKEGKGTPVFFGRPRDLMADEAKS